MEMEQHCSSRGQKHLAHENSMKRVCITGGTGFIASHLIQAVLAKEFIVTTTVRNPDKASHLKDFEGASERLKIMKADLLEENSFDAAVEDCFAVFHTASPVVVPYDDRLKETLIDPTVQGTLNLLKSCCSSKTVKKVILTSSSSCIRYDYDADGKSPLDESHWSNLDYCQRFNLWYAYAKTVAEKEAWKFAEEQGLNLVVVNPTFVVGPLLTQEPTSTLQIVLSVLTGSNKMMYPNTRMGFVHVDDVVSAHILVMENESASGRFICSAEVAHWKDIVQHLKKKYPMYSIANICGQEQGNDMVHSLNTSKIMKLGLSNFKSLEQMFDDCILSFRERGLLPQPQPQPLT